MCKCNSDVFYLFLLTISCFVNASDVFHINSKITFSPDEPADYFGYSVLISEMGFHVGAPKAKSRTEVDSSPGAVFACSLYDLNVSNVTCYPLDRNGSQSLIEQQYFKDDMWYGATMAAADDSLLVCAPRLIEPYEDKLLANGACFVYSKDVDYRLLSLNNDERPAFTTEGGRKDYGEYDGAFNYYAYGQAGMSVAYTKDEHLVIGAPGVLQWTGAVLNYKRTSLNFVSLPSANPAYTKELNPDDYFGYTVESGVFEKNGTALLVAAVPRSKMGYGQVLIFEPSTAEKEALKIKARLRGPQLGAYFGAALCTLDLNGDGVSDLLVGSPNYATRSDGLLTYDQGAVFVYITKKEDSSFIFEDAGFVGGSGKSGSRFGTTIADLGDIDNDGNTDVAIGAPWEDDGNGVVYIYKGSGKGLLTQYYQKIHAPGARGFGMSIARGYDVDFNGCNDLAIGAHDSGTAYIYRSIPTIQVMASIKVPQAKNLVGNASSFTAQFCNTVGQHNQQHSVELDLQATIKIVDPENNVITQNNVVTINSIEENHCYEHVITVEDKWDLFKPIRLDFQLRPYREIDSMTRFPEGRARLSESSVLRSSLAIILHSDCGDDLICTPWLKMTIQPIGKNSSYVPGTNSKLGAKITVTNLEEPAHSVKLHVVLPCPPKRLPSSCSLQNLDLICDLPEPLNRNRTVDWDIELEYSWNGTATELTIKADLEDPLYQRNITEGSKELVLNIIPHSSYDYFGKTLLNSTIVVTRETLNRSGEVFFTHFYQIRNHGPSDLYHLIIEFHLSTGVTPANEIEGATLRNSTLVIPPLVLQANNSVMYQLPLRFDLTQYGKSFEENGVWNLTSAMFFKVQQGSFIENRTIYVTTTLLLEPNTPMWPMIVGILLGLLLLAAIILALYKYGFFSRQNLKNLEENKAEPASSQPLL